ncbi:MAG: signal peptidase II [Desulfobacterales bacterium]
MRRQDLRDRFPGLDGLPRLLRVAGGILVFDQATKALVLAALPPGGSLPVIPGFFDLTHVRNPGGAFGFLQQLDPAGRLVLFATASIAAVLVLLGLYLQTPPSQKRLSWGLALVFGGALGNLVDRFRFGEVVDFLDLYVGRWHWPAFNVADSAITVGVGLFALQLFFPARRRTEPPDGGR